MSGPERVWEVAPNGTNGNGVLMPGGKVVARATCHHRGRRDGACGGCYARRGLALLEVERHLRAGNSDDALGVIEAVNAAQVAEGKKQKKKKGGGR